MRRVVLVASLAPLLLLWGGSASALDPVEAELTIRIESDLLYRAVASFEILRLDVSGPSLKSGHVGTLVDETGQHQVDVEAMTVSYCDKNDASEATAIDGTGTWCLLLTGIETAHKYTGTISQSAQPVTGQESPLETPDEAPTSLKLTLTTRQTFLGLPLLTSLVALVIASLWTWWTGSRLRQTVSSNLLEAELARNPEASGQPIVEGLATWVHGLQRSKAKTDEQLRALVVTILEVDAPRSLLAREQLQDAIAVFESRHPGWSDSELVVLAKEIHPHRIKREDLYDDTGARVALEPAAAAIQRLARANRILRDLAIARTEIVRVGKEVELNPQAQLVENDVRAGTDDQLTSAEKHLDRLFDDIYGDQPQVRQLGKAADAELDTMAQEVAEPRETLTASPAVRAYRAIIVTALLFVVLAIASAASGTFASNHTFGTGWDHLGLFLATFTSASVAGIAAAVGLTALERSKG